MMAAHATTRPAAPLMGAAVTEIGKRVPSLRNPTAV